MYAFNATNRVMLELRMYKVFPANPEVQINFYS